MWKEIEGTSGSFKRKKIYTSSVFTAGIDYLGLCFRYTSIYYVWSTRIKFDQRIKFNCKPWSLF